MNTENIKEDDEFLNNLGEIVDEPRETIRQLHDLLFIGLRKKLLRDKELEIPGIGTFKISVEKRGGFGKNEEAKILRFKGCNSIKKAIKQ